MLALRHPFEFVFRITHHQGTHNLLLGRHAYQIQQGLVAGDATALDKAGNGGAQANGRCEELCIGPALLCIGDAGDV